MNNKRTYNSDNNDNSDDSNSIDNEQTTNENRFKRKKGRPPTWAEEQLDQLWTLYLILKPSNETDIATVDVISKKENFNIYTPRQILKQIQTLKRKRATTTTTTTSITTATTNNITDVIEYQFEDYNYQDSDDDVDSEDDGEPNNSTHGNVGNGGSGNTGKIVWDEMNEELLKLIKSQRHLYPTDSEFTRSIIKDKSLSKEIRFTPLARRVTRLRHLHNLKFPPPPPRPKIPIPVVYLEIWSLFKSIRSNYTSDSDAIRKILEDEKYSKEKLSTLGPLMSRFKTQYGSPENWISRKGRHSNNSLAIVVQPNNDEDEEEHEEEHKEDQVIKVDSLKELKDKLKMYENENRELKNQVVTLENIVINLNNIIEKKDEKIKHEFISSHLNGNTEVVSSNSAVIIKSLTNDYIYILFPTFNGGETTLRIVEIVNNRYHIEIKHENKTFTNISNHFIKVVPGYYDPVTRIIKHNGVDKNGIYLKKKIVPEFTI